MMKKNTVEIVNKGVTLVTVLMVGIVPIQTMAMVSLNVTRQA